MKLKIFTLEKTYVITGILFLLLSSCKKDEKTNGSANDPIPIIGVTFNSNLTYGTVTDIDGNVYKTIEIDSVVWMAENLKTTRYRNGDQIPNITDEAEWYDLTSGAYCNFDNDINNAKIYGRLYNFHAVLDGRNIAPDGWHVSTSSEWANLIFNPYTGSRHDYADLREIGSNHWQGSSEYVTNVTGFTALPGGGRMISWGSSQFGNKGELGEWWSIGNSYYALEWDMGSGFGITSNGLSVQRGYSIRCVKD